MKRNFGKNLKKAIQMLTDGDYTCVLCKGDIVYTCEKRGVKPLLDWYDRDLNLKGFSAADKVVGNAAAFIYVLLGIKEVHALVMSEAAGRTLQENGISASCDRLVKGIMNRTGTGPCPMEAAVHGITEPEQALEAVRKRLAALSNSR